MPSRNVLKIDVPNSYYHVYARGASKQNIYLDDVDFRFFLGLFERYLGTTEVSNSAGVPYEKLYNSVELLCYCLMGNHFHLLLYQSQQGGMQRLMRGVMTSYSRYFNTKYGRSGQLFESRYKASCISNQSYMEHISRYIHLNPKDWQLYPYSSIHYYLGNDSVDWLRTERILQLFGSRDAYRTFVSDYEASKRMLDSIKDQLANSIE